MEIGIVGATGLVGITLIEELLIHGFSHLHLYHSKEKTPLYIEIQHQQFTLNSLENITQDPLDVIFFATPAEVSRNWIPRLRKKASTCIIDGSDAFRLDSSVPLVIPEINGQKITPKTQFIANPNCTATIALMGLTPLHQHFSLKSFTLCSYQAASGMGRQGLQELEQQCHQWSQQIPLAPTKIFPKTLLFNAIPQVGALLPNGWTTEEEKILLESKKILDLPHLNACATCVRVPVQYCHSIAISATFRKPVTLAEAQNVLKQAPGVCVYEQNYPDVYDAMNDDLCHIGRLRMDPTRDQTLTFWTVGNQLRKGAATNMRQILERWYAFQS